MPGRRNGRFQIFEKALANRLEESVWITTICRAVSTRHYQSLEIGMQLPGEVQPDSMIRVAVHLQPNRLAGLQAKWGFSCRMGFPLILQHTMFH
jgi:hypothetical protein